MPRLRLTIEYDGTDFVGWQRQENGLSVQQAIEDAILRFTGEAARVTGAGRTDSGVHATGQVAHLDTTKPWDAFRFSEALNYHLKPSAIAILACEAVDDAFHARFSATGRRYLYRIVNRRAPLALERNRAWDVRCELDAEAMHLAAQILVGRHDFTSFRAKQCQAASPIKTLSRLSVQRVDDLILIEAAAPSFLHHQMRNIVGTLALVGHGKWAIEDVATALAACNRAAAGETAPPQGLYLTAVEYG